ncbi:hypothetical protein CT19425_U460009 [Cupriavidus taiwanensis]|uniref:Uncharacterized protein n=1 Tax=Cupriavidus taiwanensis TaxID=164546 RepID=A0A375I851_9BURK|nr:hypothetical protein CT19425_U460009 [Cupriavidus taiwanensis]
MSVAFVTLPYAMPQKQPAMEESKKASGIWINGIETMNCASCPSSSKVAVNRAEARMRR